ncbi:MAG: phosphohydrolase, partial [Ruminococcus sp.]|nr:phosphohydrolase [Ruminococcus sp.]
ENDHNYDHISTLDHQILIEARMIVDFKESGTPINDIIRQAEDVFITNTGKLFLKRAFNL